MDEAIDLLTTELCSVTDTTDEKRSQHPDRRAEASEREHLPVSLVVREVVRRRLALR